MVEKIVGEAGVTLHIAYQVPEGNNFFMRIREDTCVLTMVGVHQTLNHTMGPQNLQWFQGQNYHIISIYNTEKSSSNKLVDPISRFLHTIQLLQLS